MKSFLSANLPLACLPNLPEDVSIAVRFARCTDPSNLYPLTFEKRDAIIYEVFVDNFLENSAVLETCATLAGRYLPETIFSSAGLPLGHAE
jgi:hypothetical protein